MEIKKYVLTKDNKILEIHDKSTSGYSYVDYEKEGIIFTRTILEQDITKTSDNILDLVEVGDLVSSIDLLIIVESIGFGSFWTTKPDYYSDAIDFKDVKYIWKLQPNGDYKRYEV